MSVITHRQDLLPFQPKLAAQCRPTQEQERTLESMNTTQHRTLQNKLRRGNNTGISQHLADVI